MWREMQLPHRDCRTSKMSDAVIVAGTYAVVYGATFGYALYLHWRRKRAEQ